VEPHAGYIPSRGLRGEPTVERYWTEYWRGQISLTEFRMALQRRRQDEARSR
jgi:hypothetical protein